MRRKKPTPLQDLMNSITQRKTGMTAEILALNVSLGALARLQRQNSKKSLRAVAIVMTISAVHLSDLERGRRNWTPELVTRFEGALK
jgi:hypothetical protein